MELKPLAIDLYCGLGGWAEGFLAEGYRVIGFDIERHDYGTGGYPGELVLQDVLTLHGADLIAKYGVPGVIVASPPCQEPSYRNMPWGRLMLKRGKLGPPFTFIDLFRACFRIRLEASIAASRCIPLVIENVRGAQDWIGRSDGKFGSYHLWGDVPADLPKAPHPKICRNHINKRDGHGHTRHLTNAAEHVPGRKQEGSGRIWVDTGIANLPSHSPRRKTASALIAKIPFPLAQHIARVFKPQTLPSKPELFGQRTRRGLNAENEG